MIFSPRPTEFATHPAVKTWLIVCAVAIFCMVVLGGVTRLTESGLSMVDWRPIMGIIPPLTEADWLRTFEAYKQFPEYQKINLGMDLDGFKQIFWFEYAHRILGRAIGLIFALPLAYFFLRRWLNPDMKWKLTGLLILGGLQGLMGWYMVKSGLVNDPMVSQYRLTAHLLLAVIIFAFIVWLIYDLHYPREAGRRDRWAYALCGLLLVMIASGGFVAGTDAGLLFGTWPLMGEHFIPTGLYGSGVVHASLEDPVSIQFNHRLLAYITTAALLAFAALRWRATDRSEVRAGLLIMGLLLAIQVTLGIATIVHRVPVTLGASHQGVALLLLASVLYCTHRLNR